jgi:CheY-like chemotaxis protein
MPPEPTNPSHTILVVDDDEFVLEITARILVNAGYVVITARDGEDAWDVIVENPQKIDLLLTDISMPGAFDGVELADRVRECRPNLPILLITGISLRDQKPGSVGRAWQPFLLHPYVLRRLPRLIGSPSGFPCFRALAIYCTPLSEFM